MYAFNSLRIICGKIWVWQAHNSCHSTLGTLGPMSCSRFLVAFWWIEYLASGWAPYCLLPSVLRDRWGGGIHWRISDIDWPEVSCVYNCHISCYQMVFATGAYLNLFWLMDAGRFIFGMGGENLQVAQNAYAVGWFKGKELNMVFGLQLSMARIGNPC